MKVNKFIESQIINLKMKRRMQPKQIYENINLVNDANAKVSRTVYFSLFKFTIFNYLINNRM
jgi:hypothetical protein